MLPPNNPVRILPLPLQLVKEEPEPGKRPQTAGQWASNSAKWIARAAVLVSAIGLIAALATQASNTEGWGISLGVGIGGVLVTSCSNKYFEIRKLKQVSRDELYKACTVDVESEAVKELCYGACRQSRDWRVMAYWAVTIVATLLFALDSIVSLGTGHSWFFNETDSIAQCIGAAVIGGLWIGLIMLRKYRKSREENMDLEEACSKVIEMQRELRNLENRVKHKWQRSLARDVKNELAILETQFDQQKQGIWNEITQLKDGLKSIAAADSSTRAGGESRDRLTMDTWLNSANDLAKKLNVKFGDRATTQTMLDALWDRFSELYHDPLAYQNAPSLGDALKLIKAWKGHEMDPILVRGFIDAMKHSLGNLENSVRLALINNVLAAKSLGLDITGASVTLLDGEQWPPGFKVRQKERGPGYHILDIYYFHP